MNKKTPRFLIKCLCTQTNSMWIFVFFSPTPLLTPANDSEAPEVLPVGEEGHEDEAVEIKTFHQNPVIICCEEVQEECDGNLTADLHQTTTTVT